MIYGRGVRSNRFYCFIILVMLLPICMLFFYSGSNSQSFNDVENGNGVGARSRSQVAQKFRRNLPSNSNELASDKNPTMDPILEDLVMSKSRRKNNPIPDTRPNDCIASSSEDSPPGLDHIREKIPSLRTTIVLVPDQKHASLEDYYLTLASLLSTTEQFYAKLEIAIVINEFLTNEVVRYLDRVKEAKMPVFYLIKPSKTRKTLFHEQLELGDQLRGDVLVYLTSGLECNVGWLEAMITPLINKPQQVTLQSGSKSYSHDMIQQLQPVIVTPHFDKLHSTEEDSRHYEPENEFVRLLFYWHLRPMWYEVSQNISKKNPFS